MIKNKRKKLILVLLCVLLFSGCGHDYSQYTTKEEHVVSEYINIQDLKNHKSKCVCGYEKTERHTFSKTSFISLKCVDLEDDNYYKLQVKCDECGCEGIMYKRIDSGPLTITDETKIEQINTEIEADDYLELIDENNTVLDNYLAIFVWGDFKRNKPSFYELIE